MTVTAASAASETQAAQRNAGTEPRVERVFDRTNQFRRSVPHPDFENGKKTCIVRFPTDKEWCQRAHRSVSVRKSSNDGAVRSDMPDLVAANKELFDKIKVEGPDFDEAEASRIVEYLERCVVQETTKQGVEYTIKMKACDGSIVTHVLRIPTQKMLMDYGKQAVDIVGRKQTVETRVALEPSADLWKKIVVSFGGYADTFQESIPVIHMDAAINELLTKLREDFDDSDPED